MPMMMLNNLVAQTRLSVQRIYQVLAMPELSRPRADRQPEEASITFEQVSFHYPQARTGAALQEVSFHVPVGQIVALVGPSGAGKSTVARLLLRYADPDKGHIRIGGVDLRDMRIETLMKQISFVFQDNFLFADTIANNIRLGAPDTPLESVIAAARVAQAHEFISALSEGYSTRVGERGVFLSGGQRQRITIARALLQDRPILVLDEATAFADPEGEAALIKALAAVMRVPDGHHGRASSLHGDSGRCDIAVFRRSAPGKREPRAAVGAGWPVSTAMATLSAGAAVGAGWNAGRGGAK